MSAMSCGFQAVALLLYILYFKAHEHELQNASW